MKKGFEVFKDGVNLRERKVKRGYLRQEEMNQGHYVSVCSSIIDGHSLITWRW